MGLFEKILAVSQHPDDAAILEDLKRLLKEHFDYEEGKFCEIPNFNCVDHKMKHYKFLLSLNSSRFLLDAKKSTGPRTGWHNISRTLTISTRRDSLPQSKLCSD